MGLTQNAELSALSWIPTGDGASDVRAILRELLGRAAGA